MIGFAVRLSLALALAVGAAYLAIGTHEPNRHAAAPSLALGERSASAADLAPLVSWGPDAARRPAPAWSPEPLRIADGGPEAAPSPRSRTAAYLDLGAAEAEALGMAPPDDLTRDVAIWRTLARGGGLPWAEIDALMRRRPSWPYDGAIRRSLERAMPAATDTRAVLAFYAEAAPETARGARLFGAALIATGQRLRGEQMIVDAFISAPMSTAEEAAFLAEHGRLTAPHASRRHDRMLLALDRVDAARLADQIGPERVALTAAVRATAEGAAGAAALVAALPEPLRAHPALYRAQLRVLMRDRRYAEADALLLAADRDGAVGDAEAWAEPRRRLAREAFGDGRMADAYALAAAHGLTRGVAFAELEWLAGWIRLRAMGDRAGAAAHFERLYAGVETPISRARGAYWAARAAATRSAERAWAERAAAHPQTFYGQLALAALGRPLRLTASPLDRRLAREMARDDLALAARRLLQAGHARDARRFMAALGARQATEEGLAAAAAAARALDDPWSEIMVGQVGERRGVLDWAALFPAPQRIAFDGGDVDAALLLGVARQESRFDPQARSHRGARGYLQLMPATAKARAADLQLAFSTERLSADPSYNVALGDAHMARLLRLFAGAPALAVAAYNAGEGNVAKWIARFGDPRDPAVDGLDWIERIPFPETRNYVQRVLEAQQVYRLRLADGAGAISLTADLGYPPVPYSFAQHGDPAQSAAVADDAQVGPTKESGDAVSGSGL